MFAHAFELPFLTVFAASLIATVTDLRNFRVYNALTVPLLLTGLVYHAIDDGAAGLYESAGGMLVGFGTLIVFYAMGGLGAGDVKLMAAIGAWLEVPAILYVVLASCMAAGFYALVISVLCGRLKQTLFALQSIGVNLLTLGTHRETADNRIEKQVERGDRGRLIPFSAMVAVGVFVAMWIY